MTAEDPVTDKWARRRSARRAEPVPVVAAVPTRPTCVDRAFILWMVIGVLTALAVIGIVIVVTAFHLRAGYRGARLLLTVLGLPIIVAMIRALIIDLVVIAESDTPVWFTLLALLILLLSAVLIAATFLMWRPEATAYFRAMRIQAQS